MLHKRTWFCIFLFGLSLSAGGASTAIASPHPQQGGEDSLRTSDGVQIDSLSLTYFLRRQQLIEQILTDLYRDTSSIGLSFTRKSRLRLQIPQFSGSTTGPPVVPIDPVQEELESRSGRDAILDFNRVAQAVSSLAKKKKARPTRPKIKDLPIPSPLELQVLATIWEKGKATGPEVYVAMDSSTHLTAEMTWRLLRTMARKGYLIEKQVSPRLPFTIQLPFYAVEIEVSAKNRRNRVYEYRPQVDANELLHYLLARRYLQQTEAEPFTNGAAQRPSSLDKLINIILQYRLRNM